MKKLFLLFSLLSLLPWFSFWTYPIKNEFTVFSAFFASAMLFVVLYALSASLKLARQKFSPLLWATWGLVLFIYAGLEAIYFPGLISIDEFFLATSLSKGLPSGWHSFTYSVFMQAGYFLTHQIFASGIFQTILVTLIAFLMLLSLSQRQKWRKQIIPCLVLLVILCSPFSQAIVLFLNRDSLFTLGLVTFVLALISRPHWAKQTSYSLLEVTALSLALVLLGDLRQDAKVMVVVFAPLLFFMKLISKKELFKFLVSLTLLGSVYYWAFPRIFDYQPYSDMYQLISYVNPLSEVLAETGSSSLSKQEFDRINKVLDVNLTIQYYALNQVDPVLDHAGRSQFTPADFQEFAQTAQSVILRHWPIFIKNRIQMAKTLLNFDGNGFLFSDDRKGAKQEGPVRFNDPRAFPSGKFVSWHFSKYLPAVSMTSPVIRFLLFSLGPPLLVLLFLAYPWAAWTRWISIASLLILSRLPGVILLAPIGATKYLGSIWLGAWILLWLAPPLKCAVKGAS